jgi:glycosyltransferase involved in cell wall biosynthesis
MNIWLLQANEPMPIVYPDQRLFRMGLIAEELNKRGHNIVWFATTFDHFKKKQRYNKDTNIKVNSNYNLCLIWAPPYQKNISVKRIINHKYMANRFIKIAKKMQKPDLIYVSFPTIDFAEKAVKYGKENNIPVIVDIRDLWPDIFIQNLSKAKRLIAFPYIKLMQKKTRKIMKDAYALNGITPRFLEWGLKKANKTKTENDRFFYTGYNQEKILSNQSKIEINKNKFNLCFFGTLNNQFHFEDIVNLAKQLKNENIDIYVCGLGQGYDYLKKESLKLPNLKLTGWIGQEDLQYVLSNSKMGLATYKPTFDFQMSVSNKFSEYLSYGLPVILTSGGYMGNLIDKNNCGINSSNENEIVKYIIKLKNDNNLYKEVSQNAYNLYKKEFVAEEIYSNLVDYLENIYKKESNKK